MSELKVLETRKITVFDLAANFNKVYDTNTTSWSDVAAMVEADGHSLDNKSAILGSSKAHLVLPDANIPEGEQRIFLVQKKMDSGAKAFSDMTYLELRRACKGMDTGSNPTKTSLVKLLTTGSKYKETKKLKEKKAIVAKVKKQVADSSPVLKDRVDMLEQKLGEMYSIFNETFLKLSGKVKMEKAVIVKTQLSVEEEARQLANLLR